MANTIDWGKATQNNTNGFGKYQNTINAGDIYANSWAGETVIVGTSAAFSYSKSSYHQGEADPTPTITGTTGGSFVCTSGAVFVDTGSTSSSTGQIDLDASTIDTHLISYTVDGVTATQNVGVSASPFLANTYSMEFDGVDDYIDCGASIGAIGTGVRTFSVWLKTSNTLAHVILGTRNYNTDGWVIQWNQPGILFFNVLGGTSSHYTDNKGIYSTTGNSANLTDGNWHHLVIVRAGSGNNKIYVDGVSQTLDTTYGDENLKDPQSSKNLLIGAGYDSGGSLYRFFDGNLDEVAIWNTALSSDAVTEIYNATNNNSGKALDLSTDSGNYSSSSNLQYWNRMGD